jgi:hypothetical protein
MIKKLLISLTILLGLSQLATADELKNSLLSSSSSSTGDAMVNLDNLNVGGAPKAVHHKPRSGKAVIGTVNGHKIYKKKADKFLKVATKGKITDFDRLPKKQRDEIVKNLAATTLIEVRSRKEVSKAEKNKLAAQYWMGKKLKSIKVSKSEAKKFYNKNKKSFKDKNGKQLSFKKVENYVIMTIRQQKFSKNLMKKAKIVIK